MKLIIHKKRKTEKKKNVRQKTEGEDKKQGPLRKKIRTEKKKSSLQMWEGMRRKRDEGNPLHFQKKSRWRRN